MKTGGILEGDNVWEDLVRDGMEVVIIAAQQPPRECIDGHRLKSRRNEHLFRWAHRYLLDCRCLISQPGRWLSETVGNGAP